jgi:hypothetical protein
MKTHAARRVSRDPTTVAATAAHRARAVERARLCEHELDNGAFVFSHEVDGSTSWYPDSVSRSFARLCRNLRRALTGCVTICELPADAAGPVCQRRSVRGPVVVPAGGLWAALARTSIRRRTTSRISPCAPYGTFG